MKVRIKEHDIELCYTNRMMIIFENITGHSITPNDEQPIKQAIILLYSCILGSIKKAKLNLDISYEEFMDWLDEDEQVSVMNDFAAWIMDVMYKKKELLIKKEEEENDFPESKKA